MSISLIFKCAGKRKNNPLRHACLTIHHHHHVLFIAAPEFRGCAEANFVHENKCSRELQAVTVVENQKYVDVEVDLCYCDTALCNKQRNGATKKFFRPELAIAFVALMLSFQARLLS